MLIIGWNSQGAKWDTFWNNYLFPHIGVNVDIVGLLVEAGWAPWVQSVDVRINTLYPCTEQTAYFKTTSIDPARAAYSTFAAEVTSERKYYGFWIPWIGNFDALKTNSRCSIGGVLLPKSSGTYTDTVQVDGSIRPTVRVTVGQKNFVVFMVHLISGWPAGAVAEMFKLVTNVTKIIPQGYRALVIGDMNYDLLTYVAPALPKNWRLLHVGYATQKSGGELDYGLLYDPKNKLSGATVTTLANVAAAGIGPPPPISQSDHAVMIYNIPV